MYQQFKIQWVDSRATDNTWESKENIERLKPALCESVGFLLEDNDVDNFITIASTISQDQVLFRLTIPKGCILEMTELTSNRVKKNE